VSLVLAVFLAVAGAELDAGTDAGFFDSADPLYSTCQEAPQPVQLDGGSWLLGPERASRNACLMVSCDERRRVLETAVPQMTAYNSLGFYLALFALGIGAGGILGWGLRELVLMFGH